MQMTGEKKRKPSLQYTSISQKDNAFHPIHLLMEGS